MLSSLPAAPAGRTAHALDRPEPANVDALVARGCVGISIAAGALADPEALERELLSSQEELRATVALG